MVTERVDRTAADKLQRREARASEAGGATKRGKQASPRWPRVSSGGAVCSTRSAAPSIAVGVLGGSTVTRASRHSKAPPRWPWLHAQPCRGIGGRRIARFGPSCGHVGKLWEVAFCHQSEAKHSRELAAAPHQHALDSRRNIVILLANWARGAAVYNSNSPATCVSPMRGNMCKSSLCRAPKDWR